MEKTTIDSLLNSLVALVGDARGSLFGQDKCMVDKEQLLYLVDALQAQIPQEISQSKAVIESCNELRTNAKKVWEHPSVQEAAGVAQAQANKLYSESKDKIQSSKLGEKLSTTSSSSSSSDSDLTQPLASSNSKPSSTSSTV